MLSLSFAFSSLPCSSTEVRSKALHWAQQYPFVAGYESSSAPFPSGGFRNILAVGLHAIQPKPKQPAFDFLQELLLVQQNDRLPLFGHLVYELKDEVEELESLHPVRFSWPGMLFFQPEVYLEWMENELIVFSQTMAPELILEQLLAMPSPEITASTPIRLQPRISKEAYLDTVQQLRKHIEEGDVYEINFCQEFFAEGVALNPVLVYQKLEQLSPVPFGTFYKAESCYLLGASPERFLKQKGSLLSSQPIKGTAPRSQDQETDRNAKTDLRNSEKEIAENMMIVDLVRNDLARVCEPGSIQVPELFGIYSFRQVHQMISSVEGQLKTEYTLADAFKALFPMGSMTGAPKVSAIQLIERYESSRRELFSGSVGYIFPDGTADWNVVIRSLQYNSETGYINAQVGSAITWDSISEAEYDECLLKASAMNKALGNL